MPSRPSGDAKEQEPTQEGDGGDAGPGLGGPPDDGAEIAAHRRHVCPRLSPARSRIGRNAALTACRTDNLVRKRMQQRKRTSLTAPILRGAGYAGFPFPPPRPRGAERREP